MLFRKRNRARIDKRQGCDCCNSSLVPSQVKKERRRIKRRERRMWKKVSDD